MGYYSGPESLALRDRNCLPTPSARFVDLIRRRSAKEVQHYGVQPIITVIRCPRTGRACSEVTCQERHWRRKMLERGLSRRGLPLKRKFRPRCYAKTRAGAPCRLVPCWRCDLQETWTSSRPTVCDDERRAAAEAETAAREGLVEEALRRRVHVTSTDTGSVLRPASDATQV
jgi:hypothetical protein